MFLFAALFDLLFFHLLFLFGNYFISFVLSFYVYIQKPQKTRDSFENVGDCQQEIWKTWVYDVFSKQTQVNTQFLRRSEKSKKWKWKLKMMMKEQFMRIFFNQGEVQKTCFLVDIFEKDIFSRRKGWFFERTRLKNATKRRNKKEKNNWRRENEKGDRKQEEQHRKEKGGWFAERSFRKKPRKIDIKEECLKRDLQTTCFFRKKKGCLSKTNNSKKWYFWEVQKNILLFFFSLFLSSSLVSCSRC